MSIQPVTSFRDDTQAPNDDITRAEVIARVAEKTDAALTDLAYTRVLQAAWSDFSSLSEQNRAIDQAIEHEVAAVEDLSGAAADLLEFDTEARRETYVRYDEAIPWMERSRPAWAHRDHDRVTGKGDAFSSRSSVWQSRVVLAPASIYPSKATAQDGRILSTFTIGLVQRVSDREPIVGINAPDGNSIQLTVKEASQLARALLLHVDLAVEGGAIA